MSKAMSVKTKMLAEMNHHQIKILVFGHKEFSQLFGTMTTYYQTSAQFYIVDAIVGSISEVEIHIDKFNPDVVISAGSNAAYLKSNLNIPVLALPVTDADIITATTKAAKACSVVKLISYDSHDNLVPLLQKALDIRIDHHTYSTAKQARELFYLLENDNRTAIVGASLVCDLAAQNGFKSFMYYSAQSCRDIIEQAISIAQSNINKHLHQSFSHWVIKNDSVPLVYVDAAREEVIVTRAAELQFDLVAPQDVDFNKACLTLAGECESLSGERIVKKELEYHGRGYSVEVTTGSASGLLLLNFDVDNQHSRHTSPASNPSVAKVSGLLRYESEAMTSVLTKVNYFARSSSNVLITGESGTGKELIARSIHAASAYAEGAFVALNCSAIPTELFEGELFGHMQGAYTGARKGGRKGLIHEAQKGVLFLDEVSELSFDQQAKLLRFIQERCYRPVGGNQEIQSDLKIVAATNKPLSELIEKGTFRHDLFYRLNVLNISIPPLRNRREDIICIAQSKLRDLFARDSINADEGTVLEQVGDVLCAYQWPGNVRELENILERLCASLLMTNQSDSIQTLLLDVAPELALQPNNETDSLIVAKQLEMVAHAMEMFNGDKQRVADYLGMSQTTLWRRLKKINQQQTTPPLGDTHAEI